MKRIAFLVLLSSITSLSCGCQSSGSKVANNGPASGPKVASSAPAHKFTNPFKLASSESATAQPAAPATPNAASGTQRSPEMLASKPKSSGWRGFLPSKNNDEDRDGWWTPDYRAGTTD